MVGFRSGPTEHRIGPDWVKTVCKGYQQTTKVSASMGTVNSFHFLEWKIGRWEGGIDRFMFWVLKRTVSLRRFF